MGRRWNRVKAVIYTRFHWISELWARRTRAGAPQEAIPLPSLAPPRRPLPQARIALLTSAGVHLVRQPPFDMSDPEGDASYRVIPRDVSPTALRITHDYYDHRAADRDINCVFPIERLRELESAREIGGLAPRHVGMMGHILGRERERLLSRTAPEIAALFAEDGVDLVLASPG